MNENEYLGERALFFHEKRSATAKANSDVEVFYLDKEAFITVIQGNLQDFLMNRLYLQDNTVEINNLLFCAQLGSGNYGKVSLVKNLKNNFFYAIKSISRKQIDSEQLHTNLELERNILLRIDHPFIVKLVKTLKDQKYIYFLMEYIKGKELFDVIRDIGLLNKQQTQFYGASMMMAVEYLHEKKVVYRDIKPENVIVIQNGYIKLIDFGTAKEITDRTNTIIGTPHYMAPEVVLGEGYSFQVDMWSIAICMYEFMCGGVAFGEDAEDPMDVYLSIINDKMVFPQFCKDQEFKDLMVQMLNKNAMMRFSKLAQVKSHVWYKEFNWEDLHSLKMVAPYLPKLEEDVISDTCQYGEYVKKFPEYVCEKENEITSKQLKEFSEWYNKF
jgi:cGMP-dependent protein kinase